MPSTDHTHIRVPRTLKARLDTLAAKFKTAYERGQRVRVAPIDECTRDPYVPLWKVIEAALDELEAHQKRSTARKKR